MQIDPERSLRALSTGSQKPPKHHFAILITFFMFPIKPTMLVRLKLFSQGSAYHFPLIDVVVGEALHSYVVSTE
jgi:hypothetical protein